MADLKIITRTIYTYETSDGRVFDSEPEAKAWQHAIDTAERIVMLDSKMNATAEVDMAYFVYIRDQEQLEAFNAKQEEQGIESIIRDPGYYYYDERFDKYVNIDNELERLLGIKQKLKSI